jgi:hypothetical protein
MFHMHANASTIVIIIVLAQPREESIDHALLFSSKLYEVIIYRRELYHDEMMTYYGLCTPEI